MKLVVIESPYAGEIEKNELYTRYCVRHSLNLGEAPIASHLLYTQVGILKDWILEDRTLGIAAGQAWTLKADLVAVYINLGLSPGMKDGIEFAESHHIPYEFRTLEDWPMDKSTSYIMQSKLLREGR